MSLPANRLRPAAPPPLTVRSRCPAAQCALLTEIVPIAAVEFNVTPLAILSRRRQPELVKARAFVAWALRSIGRPFSYPVIARLLDERHHTAAMNLHELAIRYRVTDQAFREACERLAAIYSEVRSSHDAAND